MLGLAFRFDISLFIAMLALRSLSGAYNYTLTLSIAFDRKLVVWWKFGSTVYGLYNVTYRGVMNLTYNRKPAALDAFYGWYYMLTNYTPPPPPPPGPPPVGYIFSNIYSMTVAISVSPPRSKTTENKNIEN